MKCKNCGCEMKDEMEEGYEEEGEESGEEGGEMEGEDGVIVKEMQVPADKEEAIKKKLAELGKMLASIK